MASNSVAVEFQLSQDPLTVPALDDIGPVPDISHDSQSFVVIKSAADFDDILDDNEIADISLLQEHKQILREEIAQCERNSSLPQPSSPRLNMSQISNSKPEEPMTNGLDPIFETPKESTLIVSDCLTDAKNSNEMNFSVLPAMPQPQICADDNDQRAISIVSFAPSDFGSEEIQTKVTQLIDENTLLKDTIIQNNLSMKAQYERFVAWKTDVERVHEEHKEKFREAKRFIETLKEENSRLKQENDSIRALLEQQRTDNDKTKQLLTETTENNLKEFELDIANKKIVELEEALNKLTIKNGEELALETSKWEGMEKKLQRYETELENAYKQINEFEKGVGEQNSELGKLKLTQEKLLLSEMANERAEKEILSLRSQLAKTVQTADNSSKVQATLNQLTDERDRLRAELESRNASIMDAHLRCQKLEENLQQASDMMRKQEETINDLKEKEEQAKIEAWMAKQKLTEVEQKCQYLQNNMEASQPLKSQYVPESNPGELAYLRQQLMQSQKALIESEQNRAVADAKVGALSNEIGDLRRQIETKENDGDDLFALRAQLDVYKTDFEDEREAKEDVKREKNKIAEDLQHLHRRNQQLQEEIELLREQLQQYGSMPQSSSESRRNQATSSSREEYIYKCPKCNFGFNTLNAVENHIIRCIELDDSLP